MSRLTGLQEEQFSIECNTRQTDNSTVREDTKRLVYSTNK